MNRVAFQVSVILLMIASVACTPTTGGQVEVSVSELTQIGEATEQEGSVQLGEVQKVGDYTLGPPIEEVVTVYNCDNPIERSDTMTEVQKISRIVDWSVVGEVGVGGELSAILAGVDIEGRIASGYELEVGEEMARGRELHLPVMPFRSADYVIVYQPAVWSGYLPFTFQSGEARIEYTYQQLAFGEVKGIIDRTERDCSRLVLPTEMAPPIAPVPETADEATTDAPTAMDPADATPVVEPLWIESNNNAADATTQIARDLTAGEWLYVSSGSIAMKGSFCGNEERQVCVLIYEATSPQTVVVDYVDQGHAFVARTRIMGYEELIDTHSPLYWTSANCTETGCDKATILYFRDGVQVNNPVTLLRPVP